jgi:hypothetical protein
MVYVSRGRWAADVIASRGGSLRRLLSPWRWERDEPWMVRVMVRRETAGTGPLREWLGFEARRTTSGVVSARASWPWQAAGSSRSCA